MSLHKFSIRIASPQIEDIEHLLEEHGAISISMADAGDYPLLEPLPGEMPLWPDLVIAGLFANKHSFATLAKLLQARFNIPAACITQEVLPQQDWVRACIDDFKPMSFGSRLWICPSWHKAPDPEAVNIVLDPGLAFGTGTHPTTSLCLQFLDAHARTGDRILDYGCGSGVLAIAALALGAQTACAVDIDPQALVATWENAMRNHIDESRLRIIPPQDIPTEARFDRVMANILSGPLIGLAPTLAALTQINGDIVLAGLLSRQVPDIIDAYQPWFAMQAVAEQEDWVLLHGIRNA